LGGWFGLVRLGLTISTLLVWLGQIRRKKGLGHWLGLVRFEKVRNKFIFGSKMLFIGMRRGESVARKCLAFFPAQKMPI